jgi:small subunit ribosomal protein S2
VKAFASATKSMVIAGRLLPGSLTNPDFKKFIEPDVIVITDPLADAQALKESVKMRIPIIAICDTFNEIRNIDFVIPANNKGRKALALIYWVLAKELLKVRGEIKSDDEMALKLKDFLEPKEREELVDARKELLAPRKRRGGRDSGRGRGSR